MPYARFGGHPYLDETWQASAVPVGRWIVTDNSGAVSSCSNGKYRVVTGTSAFAFSQIHLRERAMPTDFEFFTTVTVPSGTPTGGLMISFRGVGSLATWTMNSCYQLRWETSFNFITLYRISPAGAETQIGTATTLADTPGSVYGIRVVCEQQWIRCWIWLLSSTEPLVPTIQGFDGAHHGRGFTVANYTDDTTSETWDWGPFHMWDLNREPQRRRYVAAAAPPAGPNRRPVFRRF